MTEQTHTVKSNCMFCGKAFDSSHMSKVCDICDMRMEEYFRHIKEYLDEYPDRTALEISLDLDIPLKIINYFLKEQRLIAKNPSHKSQNGVSVRRCDKCNKMIPAGRTCVQCELSEVHERINHRTYTAVEDVSHNNTGVKFHHTTGKK